MWYAGIDWANEHHDALVIDEQGRQVGTLACRSQPTRHVQIERFLEQIIGSESKEQMACIIETTHGLLIASSAGSRLARLSGQSAHRRSSAIRIGSQDGYH